MVNWYWLIVAVILGYDIGFWYCLRKWDRSSKKTQKKNTEAKRELKPLNNIGVGECDDNFFRVHEERMC